MSMDAGEVGVRLLELRKELGFTQPVMAAKLDVADRTYKYYETGKRDLPASVAVKISVQFDVDLTWLFTGQGRKKKVDMSALLEATVLALLDLAEQHDVRLEKSKLARIARRAADQAIINNSSPQKEISEIFDLIS